MLGLLVYACIHGSAALGHPPTHNTPTQKQNAAMGIRCVSVLARAAKRSPIATGLSECVCLKGASPSLADTAPSGNRHTSPHEHAIPVRWRSDDANTCLSNLPWSSPGVLGRRRGRPQRGPGVGAVRGMGGLPVRSSCSSPPSEVPGVVRVYVWEHIDTAGICGRSRS